jgi:hypothetical protein
MGTFSLSRLEGGSLVISFPNWCLQYLCRRLLWTGLAMSIPRRPPCHACFSKKILQGWKPTKHFCCHLCIYRQSSGLGGVQFSILNYIGVKLQGGWGFWPVQIFIAQDVIWIIKGSLRLKVIKILGCQWNEEMNNFKINLYRTHKSALYSDRSFTILFNFIKIRQNAITVHNFFLRRTISQRKG